MTTTRYVFGASHEHLPPEALLQQAVAAERATGCGRCPTDNSGADPMRAIEVYGEQVLPELRGARV